MNVKLENTVLAQRIDNSTSKRQILSIIFGKNISQNKRDIYVRSSNDNINLSTYSANVNEHIPTIYAVVC